MEALADGDLVWRYSTDEWLPGRITASSLRTRVWSDMCCASDKHLFASGNRSRVEAFREFVRTVCSGVNRLRTVVPVDAALGLDMFVYRKQGEVAYARRLAGVTPLQLAGWRGKIMVSDEAVLLSGPQLRVEFRYLRKNTAYWRQYVCDERRSRSAFGLAVPYQCLYVFNFRHEARRSRWVTLGPLWVKVEVPQGCMVELLPYFYTWGAR